MNPSRPRLFFLDWLRIAAFFLLIVYHVGMYYVSWDWHVKSEFAGTLIEPLMSLLSPWRLGLLFLVSGVASSLMLTKLSAAGFLGQRSWRLLPALVFGMLAIVPPQSYFEVVEKVRYAGSYADFMRLYLSGYQGFCQDGCLVLPTWNHMWFVAYLWTYTLVLAAIAQALGARFDSVAQRVTGWLCGWKLIVLPFLLLALIRVTLVMRFETTHALIDDWYNHAWSFSLFALGALLARGAGVWSRMADMRWAALGLALCSWSAMTIYYGLPEALRNAPQSSGWQEVMLAVYALCAWCAIVAAVGFAYRHLNRDNAGRQYLSQAVFPVFIVHQTLIVMIAHLIKPARIAPAVEAFMLVALTISISFAIYEGVRRSALLRPLFGLPNQRNTTTEAARVVYMRPGCNEAGMQ